MRAENLHLTLAFLGRFERERLDELAAAARNVQVQRFIVVFDEPGYWKHNRIFWLGASSVPGELSSMVADLRAALGSHGFRFDPKPFVAHITLLRDARPPKQMPALAAVNWEARGFALISSEHGDEGPRYRVAAQFSASDARSAGPDP